MQVYFLCTSSLQKEHVLFLAGVQSSVVGGIFFHSLRRDFKNNFLFNTPYISVQFRLQVGEEIQSLPAFTNLNVAF